MIRVALFLISVGVLAFGVAWLADRPGDVLITWQGLRIETSLMVLAVATLAAFAVLAMIWSLVRAILRSPLVLSRLLRTRRGLRAYEAISNGLIAVGSGDVAAAKKFAAEVNRHAPGEPLALLLRAQSAQLAGDRDAADHAFRAMASRDDTKVLGLHGLFVEARRRNDHTGARAYAEEAARSAPALGWAGRAVLEFRCATGDWAGALALLEQNRRALDKAAYRRQRAVMLTARALALEDTDRDSAKELAREAVKLEPTLVPAAALAGRLLSEGGEVRKATRIVDKAWRANPHPLLAQTFSELRPGDAARDRLKRIEALASKIPGHVEGALAVARAALEARDFTKARNALASYLAAPTKRIALVMAEIERAEHNDEGRAREWLGRALSAAPDPEWTTDGHVSKHWLPVSPVTGRLDAFEWRVPLTALASPPVIPPPPPESAAIIPAAPVAAIELVPEPSPESGNAAPAAAEDSTPARRAGNRAARKPEPVIPLIHAPDDPGPEAVEES
jgi:HemY protein